ncbi:MAG: glucosaminidase domain-containing protein [Coriobacteriales bacterium]
MTKRTLVSLPIRLLLVTALLIAALPALFVQSAFAERVEGPLRADPRAYEHVDDDVLYAQGEGGFADGDMIAQAQGGSNIVNVKLTLAQMVQKQIDQDVHHGYSYDEFQNALDPNKCNLTTFADLTTASGLRAAQIDAFIVSQAKGRNGKLVGTGAAFIQAEQTYHVNAAYLVAHAILETGWGTSTLASGFEYDGTTPIGSDNKTYPAGTYYNFYGIGAYDSSPISGGRSMAVQQGWNSPEAAVLGGAQWIAKNYTYAKNYPQTTLYAMKWDYGRVNATGDCWHQYATGISWPESIAKLMDQAYAHAGFDPTYNYVLPLYQGWTVPDTNTRGMFRMYNPNSGEHFYTSSIVERESLDSAGWTYEGIGWNSPKKSKTPVYRLYNEIGGEHHYTLSAVERDALVEAGWNDEGIGWYSDDAKGVPLYRQYNPNAYANNHNYTASKYEFDHNISLGWQDEGIAWYGI